MLLCDMLYKIIHNTNAKNNNVVRPFQTQRKCKIQCIDRKHKEIRNLFVKFKGGMICDRNQKRGH